MKMKTKTIVYVAVTLILALSNKVMASTYYLNGKEVTKGQALIAKARDSKVKVTKVDEMEISDKGTLKAIKATK